MSTNLVRGSMLSVAIALSILATAPLHAEGPAVELEGYYAGEPARLTALDARARTARGMNLPQARAPERQQAIDDADPGVASPSRDEATSPLIAQFTATPTQTRR